MDTSTTRRLPPARIVALVLIAILVGGLASIRLASGTEPISVPAGAEAGDLDLDACTYETANGAYDADCGTLVVQENPADEQSPLIALPVVRIRATSAQPAEPVFWLEGGPGQSNMDFEEADRFADGRDVVMVGYRGLDGSIRLDCPEVESALSHSRDLLAEESWRASVDAFERCADRLTEQNIDLSYYGLVQQVDDMEAARTALGYDRIDLLSESAGTRTAMIYTWRYPDSIRRSVMIAVNPPGHLLFDTEMTDEQMERLAALCAADVGCSRRTDDLAATFRQTAVDMPGRWGFLPIKPGSAKVLSFFGLMQSDTLMPPGRNVTLEGWLAAAEGDTGGFWLVSLVGDLFYPKLFVWGQYAAAARIDAAAAREYFALTDVDESNLGYAATAGAWNGGGWLDVWPAVAEEDEYQQVRSSSVPTLLINGELDMSTPPQAATTELLPALADGHEVVLPGFGHSPNFWAEQPEAGTRLITTFLDSGQVDDSLYEPQELDFNPSTTLGDVARVLLAVMLVLATLTVASLAWMARHVRKRGGFGPVSSAALRSAWPVVLGIGGWFLAVLGVLTTRLIVPLDSEPLAVVAVSLPIGLGVWLAWVSRDRSATTRRQGLAGAGIGALVGGWLGFNAATVGFVGLFFAIAGATAGANLLLIALDITTARTGARPTAAVAVEPTPEHLHA